MSFNFLGDIDQNSTIEGSIRTQEKRNKVVSILYLEFKFNTTMFIIFIFESMNGCKIEP